MFSAQSRGTANGPGVAGLAELNQSQRRLLRPEARLRCRRLLGVLGILPLLLAAGAELRAQVTFTVNDDADAVDIVPGDGVCETGPGNGICTLRAAIQEANALAGADTVDLPTGTYPIAINGNDDDASKGDFDITEELTINGADEATTIVDGAGSDRGFHVLAGVTATLSGLTIQNGDPGGGSGGGIYSLGTLNLSSVTLDANSAGAGGGLAGGSASSLTLANVTLSANSATDGAGMYLADSVAGASLTDVSLVGNIAGTSGGGIFAEASGLLLTGGVLSGNSATNGAGIHLKDAPAEVTLNDVSVVNNTVNNLGGGIYAEASELTITGSTLSGNAAKDGGGIYNDGAGLTQTLTNVTVSGNSVTSEGGGINSQSGTLILTNLTISGNSASASKGGGIFQKADSVQLLNTIVANSPSGDNCNGTITDSGNNLADDATCGTIPSTLTGLDATLADNGGPTLTHKLLPGSNALDTGSNPSCPATDQRGFARPFNVVCDIGAYEESNYDVVIDGDFSEWDNGAGNEFCIDDQGGADDWTSPAQRDITKVCVASNQTDMIYLLLGFDDTSFGSSSTACMLLDTDADPTDGFADFVLCATLVDPLPASLSVELYSCPLDNAVDGCPGAVLDKTYAPADYGFSNTAMGPFGNADAFVELELPYSDLGVVGGQVLFSSFISYPGKSFLTNPRDSIFDDGSQDYTARIAYDVDNGTATTVPVTLSYFRASGGRFAVVDWATSTETGNLGFNLYAVGEERLERLNDELIPSLVVDSLEAQRYRFEFSGGMGTEFVLEDVDIEGTSRFHGPFALDRSYGSEPPSPLAPERRRVRQSRGANGELRAQPVRLGRPRQFVLPAVDLLVEDTGVHRVTYEQFLAAGFDFSGAQSQDLALTNRGRAVPIRVASPGPFGPGSYVEFVGERLETLYTRTNVYTLRVDRKAALRIEVDRTPVQGWGRVPEFYMETKIVETNRAYSFAAPTEDPWYDRRLLATSGPVEVSLEVELDDHLIGAAPVDIELSLWGVTNFPQRPDHHLEVDFNGTRIADAWFDGLADHPVRAQVPAYLLSPAENTLRLRLPHDTGAKYDLINYDHYRVTYPRRFVARDGGLVFRAAGASFRVEGLSSTDAVVYRVTDDITVLLRSIGVRGGPGTGEVNFPGTDELATYYVAGGEFVKTPGLREAPRPTPVVTGSADLLIVAHPDFVEGLAPLVAARRSQGYSVRVVDVEEIYARFAAGIFDPEAIRAYLAHAYADLGTRYVILVGGDTHDYLDYLDLGSVSYVPTLYAQTDSIVRYAPVDALYGDIDRDGLQDLAIGRFPVRTAEELEAVVAKVLEFERRDHRTAVLATDSRDVTANYSFSEAGEDLEGLLPSGWRVTRADMDELGLDGARELLLGEINAGVDLVSYYGHSGPGVWSFEGLFRAADADLLENSGRPMLVTQWGCWNTYYVSPSSDSLGQRLLLGTDRGAASVLGAATLTDAENERELGHFFFRHLAGGALLGDAILGAKRELFENRPGATDVLLGWTLLGDPTLAVMAKPSRE